MTDKELMQCLRRLKDEGVTFKYVAEHCGIPQKEFYNYTFKRAFPYFERQKIESYLFSNFKDIIYDECFSKER